MKKQLSWLKSSTLTEGFYNRNEVGLDQIYIMSTWSNYQALARLSLYKIHANKSCPLTIMQYFEAAEQFQKEIVSRF